MERRNFLSLSFLVVSGSLFAPLMNGCCTFARYKEPSVHGEVASNAIKWLKENFGSKMIEATKDTPFSIDILCAIICEETANEWVKWINKKSTEEILKLCVFDASGDDPTSPRDARPKNTEIFLEEFGKELTDMLITEANKSRIERGYEPQNWVYKGYGIFQYDLQHIYGNRDFFENKKWYNFEECLKLALSELNEKWRYNKNDMFATIKAYNGSGCRAENYAENVMSFIELSKSIKIY